MAYVVARTGAGRPSLQHRMNDLEVTICGLDISAWSRHYMSTAIKEIFCKKCNRGEMK